MGWLSNLLTPKQEPEPPQQFKRLKVVGESNYQPALLSVAKVKPGQTVKLECFAELAPEPDNPYDANAVMIRIEGQCVGYLPRNEAARWQSELLRLQAEGQPLMCHAFVGCLGTESGNPNLGVSLKLPVHYA